MTTVSRLNGWPICSPADASPTSSRTPAHGSGPMWVATPSSQWTFTTYSLPVSRRTHFPFVPAALAFYGAGIGLESIARGTLPLAMFGPHGYATVMGRLGMPSLLAQAAAPWIGALLLQRLEATGMLGVLVSVGFLNVGLSLSLYHCVSTSAGIRRRSGEPKAK